MSKPVIENALVIAWPGQRAAEDDPVADRPGQEDDQRDQGDRPDEPGSSPPIQGGDPGRDDQPGETEVDRLVAGQRGQPDEHAEADHPRGPAAARRADRARAAPSAGRQQRARTANGIVESGRAEWSRSGR